MSAALSSPSKHDLDFNTAPGNGAVHQGPRPKKTPTKPKKRVRFSDSFLETSQTSSSTGITPFVQRASLAVNANPGASDKPPRLMKKSPRLRLSLPNLRTASISAISTVSSPLSGEIQFAPLRQVLNDRTKRRLRRNNLSDEVNGIDDEKRTESKKTQEIHRLRDELMEAKARAQGTTHDTAMSSESSQKIRELEEEIEKLKEEAQERLTVTTASVASPNEKLDKSSAWVAQQEREDMVMDEANVRQGEVFGDENDPLQDEAFCDENNENDENSFATIDYKRDETTHHTRPRSVSDMSTQAEFPSPTTSELRSLIETQTNHLVNARLELEYICPGETTIGLSVSNADAKPVLDALLNRLRSLKAQYLLSNQTLSTTRTQESNLRTQFNAVLQQLERARAYGETITSKHEQNSAALQLAQNQSRALEQENLEKDKTVQKLQRALESYRKELTDLEALVTRLEAEHHDAITRLEQEHQQASAAYHEQMDEAVADLECCVAAEMQGRQEAEELAAERAVRVKELEAYVAELKGAMSEKQAHLRELEDELEKVRDQNTEAREEHEQEVGALNARIGELVSSSQSAQDDLVTARAEKEGLMRKLEEEKRAGNVAVEGMKREVGRTLEMIDSIREEYMKGGEMKEVKGLLTP